MTLEEWARAAIPETLGPLRRPPPVQLFPYQELGARRLIALLRRFRGALLFDGVGTGKSFTAAAVAREWRGRGPVAVSVPAPLVAAWRATLARFGVEADLVTHDGLAALRQPAEASLLIVDEAHRFRNVETRRYALLAERSCAGALLLVTATPLCNRLDDVRALARLAFADDVLKPYGVPSLDAVFDTALPDQIRTIRAILGIRRERAADVPFPRASRRVVRFSLGAGGEELVRGIDRLEVPVCGEGAAPLLVRSHLRARLESSPEALRHSLERQRRFYRRAREKLSEGFVLGRRAFASLFESEDLELFQELLFPEAFLSKADPDASLARAIERELKRIDALLAGIAACAAEKFDRLDAVLADRSALPAIVFTRAVATAARIGASFRRTLRTGVGSSRGAIDPRGMDVSLDELIRSFRSRAIDLLVLTDLASEGLDLQAAASVIHFDLPWTAVKLDQRNGRAVRVGQVRSSVRSIYFVPSHAGEKTQLRYVARKERLAHRFLESDPFLPLERSGRESIRIAMLPDRAIVVEDGALFIVKDGTLSADPRAVRALANVDVFLRPESSGWWQDWKETAMLLPSRIERGCPQARLARLTRDRGQSVYAAVAHRYRAGVEMRLEALTEGDAVEVAKLEELLAGSPDRVTGPVEVAAAPGPLMPLSTPRSAPAIPAVE